MTILVDTSAWVEYLRATGSPHHLRLRDAIAGGEPLGWTEPILYELIAGARDPARADELRGLLLRGPLLAVRRLVDWEEAARLYRRARSRGLTVRSTVDCLVASVALRTESSLLARDRDFGALAALSGLQLVEP